MIRSEESGLQFPKTLIEQHRENQEKEKNNDIKWSKEDNNELRTVESAVHINTGK